MDGGSVLWRLKGLVRCTLILCALVASVGAATFPVFLCACVKYIVNVYVCAFVCVLCDFSFQLWLLYNHYKILNKGCGNAALMN